MFYKLLALFVLAVIVVLVIKIWSKHTNIKPRNLGTVDHVLVDKSDRALFLYNQGEEVARYRIALGDNPIGHKQYQGDSKTPEGHYVLDWRNPNSRFHLSLHISYPNNNDKEYAKNLGKPPGGDIMIHGLPNDLGAVGSLMNKQDWTDGCIAVSNIEIEEIWNSVANGTPIEIRP